ncbi:MAG: hypothetical protein SFW07_04305 [Gammaproteobacteria bacterium]|nr:hypothetical protein [Gammaproteobacteria bacterium]
MDEENFETVRRPSDGGSPKLGRTWEQEVLHLCGPFVGSVKATETKALMDRFIEKYRKDPSVVDFGVRYQAVCAVLEPLSSSKIEDPVQKLNFALEYFREDPSRVKAVVDFISVAQQMDRRYKIFDSQTERRRKNNLTAIESAKLERNLSPLFQWLPKIELHLQSKNTDYPDQLRASTEIARRFQAEMKIKDLEDLFREQGPNPFKSIFAKRRHAAYARIQTCKPEHIADFLIRHKDDHPEYIAAFFRTAKRGDRDFLKEFDLEHDHASLNKLYSAKDIGLKFVDKINKAYHYRMEVRVSLDECKEKFLDKVIPKELQNALIAKMEKVHKDGFSMPTAKELSDFINDLKAALNNPNGLKHADYLKLLMTTPPRTAIFGLERNVFAEDKTFKAQPQRPIPVVPPRRAAEARPVSQVKPQRH